jgi:hypothetical protein
MLLKLPSGSIRLHLQRGSTTNPVELEEQKTTDFTSSFKPNGQTTAMASPSFTHHAPQAKADPSLHSALPNTGRAAAPLESAATQSSNALAAQTRY